MTLTSSTKTILRWGGIITTSLIYLASVLVSVLDYGITRKYTDILNDKAITVEACNAVVTEFDQYYGRLIDVSLFGYIISTVLILIIFKKVR
jgi:hypothetical protein